MAYAIEHAVLIKGEGKSVHLTDDQWRLAQQIILLAHNGDNPVNGRLVAAIKVLRLATGLSLADAKMAIEAAGEDWLNNRSFMSFDPTNVDYPEDDADD